TRGDNNVILLNPAAQEMMGLGGHPWDGQILSELTTNEQLLKIFSPDSPSVREVPLPDGRTMWASITDIPDIGRVTVLRDVTAFKALDKMKREFVAAFTHDLRTPLATVKGYVELVRMDGPLTDRQEEDLEGVTRAANLMKSLIEDLLQLSRLERLEELVREEINLEKAVNATVASMSPLAQSKQIDMTLAYVSDNLVIEGNPVLLSRAVGNLIDNAIKYTPKGGQVRVELGQQEGRALVSVIDNGAGIRAKDLPRVFEKFFRARAVVDDDVPGTGLGLAIVKSIAEHHAGQVWAESTLDQGSTFTIALPLIRNGKK
ncbi:MAG: hypothetical protein KDF65_15450, partial [Anaerolineae bacterium]|nr:hypothetical protein [Anaerolineae bacterium]